MLGFDGQSPQNATERLAVAFLFAIETGMRTSEIAKFTGDDIDGSIAICRDTKNATTRKVSLLLRARTVGITS